MIVCNVLHTYILYIMGEANRGYMRSSMMDWKLETLEWYNILCIQ